jgi:hypothetical protein
MTKVLRSMPRTFFPYRQQLEREPHLFLEALVRGQRIAGMPNTRVRGEVERAVGRTAASGRETEVGDPLTQHFQVVLRPFLETRCNAFIEHVFRYRRKRAVWD